MVFDITSNAMTVLSATPDAAKDVQGVGCAFFYPYLNIVF